MAAHDTQWNRETSAHNRSRKCEQVGIFLFFFFNNLFLVDYICACFYWDNEGIGAWGGYGREDKDGTF